MLDQHKYVAPEPDLWPHLCVVCQYDGDHPNHRALAVHSGQSTEDFRWGFTKPETTEELVHRVRDQYQDWTAVDLSAGARVARGMTYVQRVYPDALSRVDLDTLDMGEPYSCVLGQLHGEYAMSPEFMAGTYGFRYAHGFIGQDDRGFTCRMDHERLTELWRVAFRAWASR